MSLLGVRLTLLIGPTVPVPAPAFLLEALDRFEVTESDSERSAFQITFRAGRDATALVDYPLLRNPLLAPGARLIAMVDLGTVPKVLIDGLITHQQLSPGDRPGTGLLTVTGEDLSVVLDREEKNVEHTAQNEVVIANKIIASYARYGLVPMVIPPPTLDFPSPTDRIPVQRATDLAYLQQMAERYGYVFHINSGPVPGTSLAYWGPPLRLGPVQPALSVDMGSDTNVSNITFKNDAAAATRVEGTVQDRQTNLTVPVRSFASLRPPLALSPALANLPLIGKRTYHASGGKNAAQALAEAQGQSEATTDTVQVDGQLDAGRYGGVLRARGLVGLRGVGLAYDGLYYVKQVTHAIGRGEYSQAFSLAREGTGTTVPLVPV